MAYDDQFRVVWVLPGLDSARMVVEEPYKQKNTERNKEFYYQNVSCSIISVKIRKYYASTELNIKSTSYSYH